MADIHLANAIRHGLPNINRDFLSKCGDGSASRSRSRSRSRDRELRMSMQSESRTMRNRSTPSLPKYRIEITQFRYREKDAAVYDENADYEVILCLYHKRRCISSVTGRYHASKKAMEILSKTDTAYEGKKFNVYLRAAFIYLMTFVRPTIETIYSFSVNPVSTYTMYKYFHATNDDLTTYTKKNRLTPKTFTLTDAIHFHEYFKKKHMQTPKTAKRELADMLEYSTMEELGWETKKEAIQFIMETMNTEAISLSLSLQKEGIQESLLETLAKIKILCNERYSR
jgi:hypothetical protein